MKTEALIQILVEDATAVKRLKSARLRLTGWILLALVCVTVGTLAWGIRADLFIKIQDTAFLLENGSLLLVFAFASLSALQLSVPGREKSGLTRGLPLVGVSIWLLLIFFRREIELNAGQLETLTRGSGILCVWRILSLGVLPVFGLFTFVRQGAPLRKEWAGSFIALASFSLATLGTQILCADDSPHHVFVWHFGPLILMTLLGALIGRASFARKPPSPLERRL